MDEEAITRCGRHEHGRMGPCAGVLLDGVQGVAREGRIAHRLDRGTVTGLDQQPIGDLLEVLREGLLEFADAGLSNLEHQRPRLRCFTLRSVPPRMCVLPRRSRTIEGFSLTLGLKLPR